MSTGCSYSIGRLTVAKPTWPDSSMRGVWVGREAVLGILAEPLWSKTGAAVVVNLWGSSQNHLALVQMACGKGHARGLQGSSIAQLALEGLACGLGSLRTQAQPHETGVAHRTGGQEVQGLEAEQACTYKGLH